jgi:methylated-DNA-protein-cysteine methyltransferase-like protein
MKKEVLDIVSWIPYGKVLSYGRVAELVNIQHDLKISWYLVWRILSWLPEREWAIYPWWRVVNKQWYISSLKLWTRWLLQKQLLSKEGIEVVNDTVDMKKYWSV